MKRGLLMCLWMLSGPVLAQDAQSGDAAASPSTPPPANSSAPNSTAAAESKPAETRPENRKYSDGGVTYSAIGLSRVSTHFDNLEPATLLTAVLGIKVPTVDWIAAEVDFGQSIIPGKNDGRTSSSGPVVGGGNGGLPLGGLLGGGGGGSSSSAPSGNFTQSSDSFQLFSIGVFGVLKTPPDWFHGLYAKGKVGYGYVQSNLQEINNDASGTAYGVGAGWMYGRHGGVEFLYSKFPSQLDSIGLSVSYGFGGSD